MKFINPTLEWYKSISAKYNLPPRCPFANIYKCPKYFDSLCNLEGTGATSMNEQDIKELDKYWEGKKLKFGLKEEVSGIARKNDKFSFLANFCPEVTFLRFGYFTSHLSEFADEIDKDIRYTELEKRNIDKDDWRWYFQYLTPQHYTDCSYYSILLKNHIDQEKAISEIKLTDSQRKDEKRYYKINIFGKDENRKKENYIEIDDTGVSLSENNFLVFMRLILERKINDEGWVNIKKFIEETELKISGHYQLIFRLRQNIQKILNEKETKKIIENKKSGLYRISTHPDFIIYRKADLIKDYSNNKIITQIVSRLPEI